MSAVAIVVVVAAEVAAQNVDHVVVFADRAAVTRAAAAKCEGGAAAVMFAGLPESIDPRTLRGEAEGDAVAVGVSSESVALAEALDERVRALKRDLLDVDERLNDIARAQQDENQRSRTMQSYGTYFRALALEEMRAEKPDAGRWDKILDALAADGNTRASADVTRAAEQRTLERKRERLAARLARLNPAQAPSTLTATVAVKCGASASPRVTLSYVVPGATWAPEYDVRFAPPAGKKVGDGKVSIGVAGVVTQSSGEDWIDAEIWLSTAKPQLGGEAPLPNPIYVGGSPVEKQKTLVQAQEHRAADLQTGKGTSAATSAGFEDGGKAFLLKLKSRATVHADGRPYWFPVEEVSTAGKSTLVAEASLSPYVYEVVELANPAPFPLLAGRVHVFRGATFVGDVDGEYRAPGEPFEVSLGLDEEVALERQDLLKQKREAGLLSGTQTIAHAYRTILHNRSDYDVTVEIREQIPVSKSADIEVKIDDAQTAPGYVLDKLRGHLAWKVALAKGATEKKDIAFTIGLPKDWAVQ